MGNVETFLPYFRQAKLHGLRLSFHIAEVSRLCMRNLCCSYQLFILW